METTIKLPDDKETELARQTSSVVEASQAYAVIRDDVLRDGATAFAMRVHQLRLVVGTLFDDPIAQAHKLHKMLCGRRNNLDAPLADAEMVVRRAIGTYEANKRADIEAKRLREEAEARRLAADAERERARQIDEARKAEDRRLEEAAALEAAGRGAEAESLLAAPLPEPPATTAVAPPIVRTPAYKPPAAVSTRLNWKFRIVDAKQIPRDFLIPDEKAIGAFVRAKKDQASIPGVEIYSEAMANVR